MPGQVSGYRSHLGDEIKNNRSSPFYGVIKPITKERIMKRNHSSITGNDQTDREIMTQSEREALVKAENKRRDPVIKARPDQIYPDLTIEEAKTLAGDEYAYTYTRFMGQTLLQTLQEIPFEYWSNVAEVVMEPHVIFQALPPTIRVITRKPPE